MSQSNDNQVQIVLKIIRDWPYMDQRQDSVSDQLDDLIRLGDALGMRDATEWIKRRLYPDQFPDSATKGGPK